jgi:hypothetical protein
MTIPTNAKDVGLEDFDELKVGANIKLESTKSAPIKYKA